MFSLRILSGWILIQVSQIALTVDNDTALYYKIFVSVDTSECRPCLKDYLQWHHCHRNLVKRELIRHKREDCAGKSFSEDDLKVCVKSLCMQAALPTEGTPLMNPVEKGDCVAIGGKTSQDVSIVECELIENRKIVSKFESNCKSYDDWKLQLCYRFRAAYAMQKFCGTDIDCRRRMKHELARCAPNDRECIESALSPHQRLWIFVLVFSIVFIVVISVGVVLLTLRSKAQKVKQMQNAQPVPAQSSSTSTSIGSQKV